MHTITLDMERLRNPYSGLGQFCLRLGQALAAQQPEGLQFACLVPEASIGVFGAGVTYRKVKKIHKFFPPSMGESLWHCTHQDAEYFPGNRQVALAITIHDLNFLERTDYSEAKKRRRLASLQQKINRSKGLVYISDFVCQWVHRHLMIPVGMVERVIYNGNNLDLTNTPQTPNPNFQMPTPFLFSIGIHPKKNYHVLLPILEAFQEFHWVIAGPDGRGYRGHIESEAAKKGVSARLVFTGSITEAEKHWLYRNCTALMFPSLSEGFGLPVVEAMSAGKPVFLSNRTSLPEIGGQEAYYFPDFEQETVKHTFARGMKNFENDPEKPARMSTWAAQFSWEKAAKAYTEFYKETINA
jgi:glycosyltransferase involved in cell wall biosynthesis